MERPNNFNGGLRLPIGYRFRPTDEELVVHYLRRKAFGVPLPASIIPEFDVFETEPWSLPGDLKEKRYFFSNKVGSDHVKKEINKKLAAGRGYWKPIGKGKKIVAAAGNRTVGVRKTLVFHAKEGQSDRACKSQWVMHEYRLVASGTIPSNINQLRKMRMGDWVVYSIFQRKKKPKKDQNLNNVAGASVVDFREEDRSCPCSPCLSEVTEVSSNGLDQEEITSFTIFSSCMKRTT